MTNELCHHGIKGQEWGVQNGPPYPLGEKDHSKSENKAGWRQSINKKNEKNGLRLTDGQKKAIAIGAAAIGAMYLEYKVGAISSTTRSVSHLLEGDIRAATWEAYFNYSTAAQGEKHPKVSLDTLKTIRNRKYTEKKDPETGLYLKNYDFSMSHDAESVNPDFSIYNSKTSKNCGFCSMAYDLRRRGYDVMAGHGDSGTLRQDLRNLYNNARPKHRYGDYISAIADKSPGMSSADAEKVLNSFSKEKGTRGIVFVSWMNARGGHAMCYEVLSNGNVAIVDAQVGRVYTGRDAVRLLRSVSSIESYRTDNLKPNIKKMKELNLII